MGKSDYKILIVMVTILICQTESKMSNRAINHLARPSYKLFGQEKQKVDPTSNPETLAETTGNTSDNFTDFKTKENEHNSRNQTDWLDFDTSEWEVDETNSTSEDIPLADRVLFGKETNPREFVKKFVYKPTRKPSKGKSNGDIIAALAQKDAASMPNISSCRPLPVPVEAPMRRIKPNYKIIPKCVVVERCGGCCNDETHICEDVQREPMRFEVRLLKYKGNSSFVEVKRGKVTIFKHTECACNCRVKAKHCLSPLHVYIPEQCTCMCSNTKEMTSCQNLHGMVWNPENCQCECAEKVKDCSSGYYFNHAVSCECLPEMENVNEEPDAQNFMDE